jgi:hypothetical protein
VAIVTRQRRPKSSRPADDPARIPARLTHEVEAPDAGELGREAPESRIGRQTEAPDAGDGRASLLEHEFTHGRSQS